MAHKQRHRGANPKDEGLFQHEKIPNLQQALADLCWLLSHGYPDNASLKLIGDRFKFTQRQRMALTRAACPDTALQHRNSTHKTPAELQGQHLIIDGYNLLITLETALSGGYLFIGQDGCVRDIASIHGNYKRVEETLPAIELIGNALQELKVSSVKWYFDSPVSNSGRLKTIFREMATQHDWPWEIELAQNADVPVAEDIGIAVSTDRWILDRAKAWSNLAYHLITTYIPDAKLISLRKD